jgi:hypothetical protein
VKTLMMRIACVSSLCALLQGVVDGKSSRSKRRLGRGKPRDVEPGQTQRLLDLDGRCRSADNGDFLSISKRR